MNLLTLLKFDKDKIHAKLFFVVIVLIFISWFGVIDAASTTYIDQALIQAGISFGIAKTINGMISVLQSVEISSVVVSVGVGQIFDPINDMVEKFSEWMKLSIVSLIIQNI